MTARDYFCAARDAIERISTYDQRIEAKRELAVMRARRDGPTGRGGVTDPSKRIDDLIDTELEARSRLYEDQQLPLEAGRVVTGYTLIDPIGASVIRCRYLRLMTWKQVCEELCMSYADARDRESVAFDRIDSEGLHSMICGRVDTTAAMDGE